MGFDLLENANNTKFQEVSQIILDIDFKQINCIDQGIDFLCATNMHGKIWI